MFLDTFWFGGGFEIIFFIVFILILGVFVALLVKNLGEWHRNNRAPRLNVGAKVVAKRTSVSRHASNVHGGASTRYFATFQVESGDRIELSLSGEEYGLLAEGDVGILTFQGSRYVAFERQDAPEA